MKHKRLERLAMFAEVAVQLSFAKAAEKLRVSKGHLSEQVKKLEQDYGVPLMVRTTRSVRLTTEGLDALNHFKQIDQLLSSFEQGLAKLDGTIRITAPALFSETYLTKVITEFTKLHPDVCFEVNTSYQRINLAESHFDMAFRATQYPAPENMIVKKLFNYQSLLVASPHYMKSSPELISVKDLTKHTCLTAEQTSQWHVGSEQIHLKAKIACNSNQTLKQLAIAGMGVTRLPSFYVKDELENKQLISLLDNSNLEKVSLLLLYPTTTRETNRLRQFTSFVSDYFAQTQLL